MNQPIVRLWGMEKIGLIIEHKTGVIYSNQTGGYVCSHFVKRLWEILN
ncbi:hypothetical protein [Leptospira borgpetersenii]|nr:hypothetical protein [Leptospira borgpetersenii]MBF3377874.1 hypothetical protein [Leptospira borgpetersenii serovar Balcanica]